MQEKNGTGSVRVFSSLFPVHGVWDLWFLYALVYLEKLRGDKFGSLTSQGLNSSNSSSEVL